MLIIVLLSAVGISRVPRTRREIFREPDVTTTPYIYMHTTCSTKNVFFFNNPPSVGNFFNERLFLRSTQSVSYTTRCLLRLFLLTVTVQYQRTSSFDIRSPCRDDFYNDPITVYSAGAQQIAQRKRSRSKQSVYPA